MSARGSSRARDVGATILVDEVARLVRAPASATVAAVEERLVGMGLSLGPAARRAADARLDDLLRAPRAFDRSPCYGRLIDACVGLEARARDGTSLQWRASPRKAVGPDWRVLILGRSRAPARLTEVTLAVHALPEGSRAVAWAMRDRSAALQVVHEALRRDVRPASWWILGCTLCAELEGAAALVDSEWRTLAALVGEVRGRPSASVPCPDGPARFVPWSDLSRGRAPVSQMTLDGGCLHDRATLPAALPPKLRRALRAAGFGA